MSRKSFTRNAQAPDRYEKVRVEANETRKRIVETAARELRGKGVVGAGIADIMSAAGLTPGGFYRHFESKDHLVAEACDVASATLYQTLESFVQGKPPREARREIASVTCRSRIVTICRLAARLRRWVEIWREPTRARGKSRRTGFYVSRVSLRNSWEAPKQASVASHWRLRQP